MKPTSERQKPARNPYPQDSDVVKSSALAIASRQRVVINLVRVVMS